MMLPGIQSVCVTMETVVVVTSVLLVSGALADCPMSSGLVITAPRIMEALSGSCLLIPCNFTTTQEKFISTRTTYGVWMKQNYDFGLNPSNVIYNSSQKNNIYPMNITGNLRQMNCTTLFSKLTSRHSDTFYFRVENPPVKATAVCDRLQINVRDSLKPRIQVPANLTEKDSVTIICSAFTPCPHSPPKLTWSLQADPHNHMEENPDGTFTTRIQENFTLSERHDGSIISCSATYPVDQGEDKTAETSVTLSVSYPPRNTSLSISPAGPVSAGSAVTLTCSCRSNPPVLKFVWFVIRDDRLERIAADGPVYGFVVSAGDRDRRFYCGCRNVLEVQFSAGRQLRVKGFQLGPVSGPVMGEILGVVVLVSALILFECWFWSRFSSKRVKNQTKNDYIETGSTSDAARGRNGLI